MKEAKDLAGVMAGEEEAMDEEAGVDMEEIEEEAMDAEEEDTEAVTIEVAAIEDMSEIGVLYPWKRDKKSR